MIGAIGRVLGRGLTELRMMSLADLDNQMDEAVNGGGVSWSGANVTTTTAMRHEAVWACITVRAASLARFPIITYRLLDDDSKERARTHYLYNLLRYKVNPWTTAYTWKQLMETWVCIHGNAYSWREENGRGQTTGLWAWHPSRVTVKWEVFEGYEIPFYCFRLDGGKPPIKVPYWDMLHLRGFSTDGFFGLSPISEHKQTIGLGLAVQEHGSRFFKNGASLGGILSPKAGSPSIEPDRLEIVKTRWNEAYGGTANAHKTAFLPNGLEWQSVRLNMQEAQYIETAQFNVPQICRIFGVPPHKVFDLMRSTNNNIEHQDIEWRNDYLGPRIESWEEELNGSLLSDRERQTIQIEFLINAMMRTDAAARAEYYTKALAGAPWMTQNDVRRTESMNTISTKGADEFPVTNNAPGPVVARGLIESDEIDNGIVPREIA